MLISIDFDDTFTSDCETWRNVINLLLNAGHSVVCVSARFDTYSNRHELENALPNIPVFLTGHNSKREFMENKGMFVDIWIDDTPDAIVGK